MLVSVPLQSLARNTDLEPGLLAKTLVIGRPPPKPSILHVTLEQMAPRYTIKNKINTMELDFGWFNGNGIFDMMPNNAETNWVRYGGEYLPGV